VVGRDVTTHIKHSGCWNEMHLVEHSRMETWVQSLWRLAVLDGYISFFIPPPHLPPQIDVRTFGQEHLFCDNY